MERNIRQPDLGFDRCWLTRENFTGSALGFDFGFGRRAEGMGTDRQFLGQFTIAQNFDAVAVAIHEPDGTQGRFVHAGTIFKHIQIGNVHRQANRREFGVIEAPFGDPANERHLATFKADTNGTARARGLALATATGGFSVTAGFALTEPFAAMLGAGAGF